MHHSRRSVSARAAPHEIRRPAGPAARSAVGNLLQHAAELLRELDALVRLGGGERAGA
jgi:uncharacterized protein involved in copper resistance